MQEINGRTFFPKIECEWCGANDFSYEPCGPHIKAYCNTCGHSTFVKQINDEEWRRFVKERAGYRCERCGAILQGRRAHAHHKLPTWFMPELALDPDNGICLCTECHKQIHGYGGTIREEMANDKEFEKAFRERW